MFVQSVQFERQNGLVVCAKGKTFKKVLTNGFTAFIIKAYRKGGGTERKTVKPKKRFEKIEKSA